MKSQLGHLVYLIHDFNTNIEIYKFLFAYFDFPVTNEFPGGIGVKITAEPYQSLWILEATEKQLNHRDSNGLNHIGFTVATAAQVDQFTEEFLKLHNVKPLFDTPRRRPDFEHGDSGYYQVMFELPGGILFEVVSHEAPPKA